MKFAKAQFPKLMGVADSVSPDGQAVTILTDSLVVSLDPVSKPKTFGRTPLEAQLINRNDLTVFVDVDEPGEVSATIDVRGAFSLDDGCTGVLIVRAGGNTFSREFQGKPNDYTVRFKFDHQLNAGVVVYTEILIERDLTDGNLPGGYFAVDSIDVAIKPKTKPASKKKATKKS